MAKRRKEASLVVVLVTAPWWLSVVVGGIAFVMLHWLLPSILRTAPGFVPLAAMAQSVAWVALLFFLAIGLIAFFRAAATRMPPPRDAARFPGHTKFAALSPAPVVRIDPVHADWGRSASQFTAAPAPARPASPTTATATAATTPATAAVSAWSLDALQALDWKRFELLCARYYESVGFTTRTTASGPDGGVDVRLFKADLEQPTAIIQCKAWTGKPVGVKEIRELLGVMVHQGVKRGIFMTTGIYSADATAFGAANPILLIDGKAFLNKIADLTPSAQAALLAFAFDGDYQTPSCASCGAKLIRRDGAKGPFWGCPQFPKCRTTLPMRKRIAA